MVDDVGGEVIRVAGREAEHALRVLRLKTGAEVVLFDGRGEEASGSIVSVQEDAFEVEIRSRTHSTRRKRHLLEIAAAVPKGARADWMVEKCAEFGIGALHLLRTDRGEVEPGEGKLSRWRRKAAEAAKQSGNTEVMNVSPARSVGDLLKEAAGRQVLFCDPRRSEVTLAQALAALHFAEPPVGCVLVFIGPEGGFTEQEMAAMEHAGGRPVRLARSILRVETAAAAVAAVWAIWIIDGD